MTVGEWLAGVRSALGSAWMGVRWAAITVVLTPLVLLWDALAWLWMQLRGTWRGLGEIVGRFSFDRILPNGIVGAISEVRMRTEWAFGAGSKSRGVFAGLFLIIVGVLTSWAVIGLVLIALGVLVVLFNLIRAVPAFEGWWSRSRPRRAIQRDHDVPLWSRDNDN